MRFFKRNGTSSATESKTAGNVSRRSFLEKLGLGGVLAGLAGLGFQSFRSLIPNVLYEPSKRFKIGPPANLAEGVTFLEEKRLYLFKEGKSFYEISGSCPHLGCTVKYTKLNQPRRIEVEGEQKEIGFEFHCPCHGSKFYGDGTNFAGPAPGPLQWFLLEVSPDDGQLVANMDEEVEQNFRLTV